MASNTTAPPSQSTERPSASYRRRPTGITAARTRPEGRQRPFWYLRMAVRAE